MADIDGTVTAGPFGGEGGRDWSFCPAGLDTRFTEITITYDTYITSLSFLAKNIKTGQLYKSRVFGGGGGTVQTVKLNSDQYLSTISGSEINVKGKTLVESFCFITNKGVKHGPHGNRTGTKFEPRLGHDEIVGFYGHDGAYIDSLAGIAKPY